MKAALTRRRVGRKETREEVRLFRSMVVEKLLAKRSLARGSITTAGNSAVSNGSSDRYGSGCGEMITLRDVSS